MNTKDVVLAKFSAIERCIRRIEQFSDRISNFDDIDAADIVALNLERAIQSVIDSCNIIVADMKYQLPNSFKKTADILCENRWISPEMAAKIKQMIGFRNLTVHEYKEIDRQILIRAATQGIKDLYEFMDAVSERFGQIE